MVFLRINCLFPRLRTKKGSRAAQVKHHQVFGSFTHTLIYHFFHSERTKVIYTQWNCSAVICHYITTTYTHTQKPSVSALIPVSLLIATSAALPPGSLYPWLRAMKGCTGRQKWSWATLEEKKRSIKPWRSFCLRSNYMLRLGSAPFLLWERTAGE